MNGSVTLTGGPATGLAFAPQFEQAGVPGAATRGRGRGDGRHRQRAGSSAGRSARSSSSATGCAGRAPARRHDDAPLAAHIVEEQLRRAGGAAAPAGEDKESYALLKALVVILVAMWMGSWVSAPASRRSGITLPAYIGAMLVAAVIRNVDDVDRAVRAVAADASTISAAWRCRCSSCWR